MISYFIYSINGIYKKWSEKHNKTGVEWWWIKPLYRDTLYKVWKFGFKTKALLIKTTSFLVYYINLLFHVWYFIEFIISSSEDSPYEIRGKKSFNILTYFCTL